jgi:tetratricopeptide (TPR) repeat protein
LQELVFNAYLARAETILKNPEQHGVSQKKFWSEMAQILIALTSLEPLAAKHLPAYAERVANAQAMVRAASSEKDQKSAAQYFEGRKEHDLENRFDELVETIEREPAPEKRERLIANAAQVAETVGQLERIETLAQKINESEARRQLSNWLNFKRVQLLVKEGRLDEAKQVADEIDELDHRAILYLEIAREGIKKLEDRKRARELLDEVATAAGKAPNTDVKARTLLGITHLLAEFDALRASEVMADAVKTINTLDEPDFSLGFILRRIEGKNFSVYSGYNIPGFNLENSFRELGPRDFDGALALARNLSDRTLRSTAILGLSSQCLEQAAKSPAAAPKKETPQKTGKPGAQNKPRAESN